MHSITIKAGLLTVLMLVGSASGAHAQEQQTITPEKRAVLKEFFEVAGLTQTTNSMMDMMIEQNEKDLPNILSQISSRNKTLTPEERADLDKKVRESIARVNRKLREALQRLNYMQAIEDTTASIFDKHFTESELKEWIAFYKTPVGRKMVQLMPVMMSESMEKINESLFPKLQEEISRIIADEAKLIDQEFKALMSKMDKVTKRDLKLIESIKPPPEPPPPAKAKKRKRRH